MNRLFALAVCAFVLAGCATTRAPVRPSDAELDARWQAHAAQLAQVHGFTLQGRAADGGGVQAQVHWQQFPDGRFTLRLSGPFGVGTVLIRGDAQRVEIQTRDERLETTDPEAWMRTRLGWTFPVQGLRYWILGQPAPTLAAARPQLDDQGRLLLLEQGGWSLEYREYVDSQGLALPRRLEATQGERRLKLVIDRWESWLTA